MIDPLLTLRELDAGHLARLADRLGDAADLAYRRVDTPLGPVLLATNAIGLVRVGLPNHTEDEFLAELATSISPRILAVPRRLDAPARQLDEYFAGTRQNFDVALDLDQARGFRREVLDHLRTIPYGRTESYGVVADRIGHPRAYRAVGTACRLNPLPLVVPCHRVTAAHGLGNYAGGSPELKRQLLALEGAL